MSRIALQRMFGVGMWSVATLLLLACAPNPPPGEILVVRRPPPDRVEVIGVAPVRGHIWMGGHWRWTGSDYDWVLGRWAAAERGYRRWTPGYWRHTRRGWYWVEGHWRR